MIAIKHIYLFSFAVCISALLLSCEKPGCLGEAGSVATHSRVLAAFDTLVLEDNIDLELVQGDVNKVEIIAGENIAPNIRTDLSGTRLHIANETSCRWLREAEKIKVRLYFKDLSFLEYKGSGDVTNAGTLRLHFLRIESTVGAGNIELTVDMERFMSIIYSDNAGIILHGRVERCETYTDARGQLDLSDLVARSMHIEYGGLADTEINVIDNLSALINYKGNVYYRGSPTAVSVREFSTGRLIHRP